MNCSETNYDILIANIKKILQSNDTAIILVMRIREITVVNEPSDHTEVSPDPFFLFVVKSSGSHEQGKSVQEPRPSFAATWKRITTKPSYGSWPSPAPKFFGAHGFLRRTVSRLGKEFISPAHVLVELRYCHTVTTKLSGFEREPRRQGRSTP